MKTNRTIITLVVLLASATVGTLSSAAETAAGKTLETSEKSVEENTREAVEEIHDSAAWERIAGSWKELEGDVQARWTKLTGDDLAELRGEREELVGKVQEAYGMTREEAEADVDDWASYQ